MAKIRADKISHSLSYWDLALQNQAKVHYDLQRFGAEEEGRTELPSERRKQEERNKGNVPRSQEIVSASILIAGLFVLVITGSFILALLESVILKYIQMDFGNTGKWASIGGIRNIVMEISWDVAKILGPILFVAMFTAIVANLAQFGFLFSAHPLGFRWEKLRPDFKRILLGKRTLFNLFRILTQLSFISLAAYFIVIYDYTSMLKTANMDLYQAVFLFAKVALKLLAISAIIMALVSIPDYLYQRYEYTENLKVTTFEAKRERKDEEGDPIMRQKQRDRGYELRKQRSMLLDMTKADVLITNPTHFAIALEYDPAEVQAPIVIAKGTDHLAFVMRTIAKENNIHIEENPPLARSLYEDSELGQEIPETLYRVVSLIFAKIDRFRRENKVV